ncbi:relaxation protein [Lysobacter enzymogenes]|uniref:Relaxation protein n=3 Tax=Bacteria TaxID=2 RepID=A0AAU9ALA5_LYSEN|nr:relaxation protein [Lysobacter enzymogenes]BAV95622.1 relaxation protein [Lysobacter enzymogenes]
MQHDELTALISKTAVLMEQFERRCEELERHQRALAEHLQALAQQVPGVVRQSADDSLRSLPGAVMGKLESGLSEPVGAYEKRLREAGSLLHDGSQTLAAQLKRMEQLHRHLVWKIVGAAFGSVLLLLIGGGWLLWQYRADIDRQRISAELLRAYNQADVTLCEERLCANVDDKAAAYGERKQYRPVRPR